MCSTARLTARAYGEGTLTMNFQSIASPTGFLIGAVCGLIPLVFAIRKQDPLAGHPGLLACLFSGFRV